MGGHDGHERVVRRWRLRRLPAAAGRREPPPRVGGRQRRREGFDEGGVEAVDVDDERLAQIITVASVGSYMRRATAGLAYNASKAAAAHLGKMLATMLAEWGVRSNVIAPGRQFDFFFGRLPGSGDWRPEFEHSISLGDDHGCEE